MSKFLDSRPPLEMEPAPPTVATVAARSEELATEQSRQFALENEERQRKAAEELARLQALARHD